MKKVKTPAKVIAAINFQQLMMRHIDEQMILKAQYPEENLAYWARGKGDDYWRGLAEGINTMLERVLFEHKCYAGFNYQRATPNKIMGLDGTISLHYDYLTLDHPEFAEWRRRYHTN